MALNVPPTWFYDLQHWHSDTLIFIAWWKPLRFYIGCKLRCQTWIKFLWILGTAKTRSDSQSVNKGRLSSTFTIFHLPCSCLEHLKKRTCDLFLCTADPVWRVFIPWRTSQIFFLTLKEDRRPHTASAGLSGKPSVHYISQNLQWD